MKHHKSIISTHSLYSLCIISFIAALHISIPVYFNSSFLSSYINENAVSLVYLVISIVTILGLLAIDSILKSIGNFRAALSFILIQIVIFYYLINADSVFVIVPLLILGMSLITLILFTIDIFIQSNTKISDTGSTRGLILTMSNIAWVLGPLLAGMLIVTNEGVVNYRGLYIAAFSLLLPLLYLIFKNFEHFKDPKYIKISARQAFISVLRDRDISKIFLANIVLQTFYAWMTVYVPIYLHEVIGFDWAEISIILTIMLIPFVLVNIPLGKLADRKWGEKELMITGFVILGVSTSSLIFLEVKSIVAWAIILFITRIGAATVEIMIETYFFKKIDDKDPEILSIFRITRPMSFFVAPLIATVALVYTTNQYLFMVFGVICLLTIYPISTIRDTN